MADYLNTGRDMIIYKSDNVLLRYNSGLNYVYQEWTGFCPCNVFREAVDRTFEFLNDNNIYKIIADTSEQRVVCPCDQDYVKNRVLEFIAVHKKFRSAYILREKSRVKPSLSHYSWMLKRETDENVLQFFNSLPDAVEWIKYQ
jgi:hypothetical protein